MHPSIPTYDASIVLLNATDDSVDFFGVGDTLTFLGGKSDSVCAAGQNQTVFVDGTGTLPSATSACVQAIGSNLSLEAQLATTTMHLHNKIVTVELASMTLTINDWKSPDHVTLLAGQVATEKAFKAGTEWGTQVSITTPALGADRITEDFLYASHVVVLAR